LDFWLFKNNIALSFNEKNFFRLKEERNQNILQFSKNFFGLIIRATFFKHLYKQREAKKLFPPWLSL